MSKNLKEKNGKLPGWAIAVIIGASFLTLIIFAIFIVIAVITEIDNDTDIDKNLVIEGNIQAGEDDEYNAYVINGYITNKSNYTYYDVDITYYLYDRYNNIIGEATDYVMELESGQSWKFSAEYYGTDVSEVYRIELHELEGDDYEPW